jgi:hypothetical protein
MAVPSESNRNARLDQLSAAVTAWADQRQRYLENQVAFARKVLRGRTGAERLNGTTSAQAQSLVVDELDQFLTGG